MLTDADQKTLATIGLITGVVLAAIVPAIDQFVVPLRAWVVGVGGGLPTGLAIWSWMWLDAHRNGTRFPAEPDDVELETPGIDR